MDIELYLTQEEFQSVSLPKLEIVDGKLISKYVSLECELKGSDGSDLGLKVKLEHEDFDDMSDGIKVDEKGREYFVKINDKASDRIAERGSFGTRYGIGQKVEIYVSEHPNI